MRKGIVVLILFGIGIFIPTVQYWAVSADTHELKEEAIQAVQEFYRLVNRQEWKSVSKYLSPAMTVFEENGKPLHIYLEKDAGTVAGFPQNNEMHYYAFDFDIRLAGRSAIVTYVLRKSNETNRENSKSIVTAIVKKENNRWTFVHLHHGKVN